MSRDGEPTLTNAGPRLGVSFDALIDPYDAGTFLRVHWEKRPLLVTGRDADRYEGLLSLADVDRILSTPALHSSTIRLVREGHGIKFDKLWSGGAIGDHTAVEELLAEYRLGATISLTGLDRTSKPLRELCASLERRFSAVFQANAYLTPASSQGFDTHCDTHDVFVLQIQGTKRWKVFDAPVELPVEFRKMRNAGELPVLLEVELQPGDLLYLPRGYPHHAVSAEATSLHVTLGAHTQTWATLIRAAVEECVHRDVRFRTSLPPEFATTEAGRRSAVDRLTELLHLLANDADVDSAVDSATQKVQRGQRRVATGRLLDIESAIQLSGDTRVQRRPEVSCAMTVADGRVHLQFHDKVITVPGFAVDEIRHLLEADDCRVDRLPGGLDEDGRIVLVRRLIKEGLLTVRR